MGSKQSREPTLLPTGSVELIDGEAPFDFTLVNWHENLPPFTGDVVRHIFSFLTARESLSARNVCTLWRSVDADVIALWAKMALTIQKEKPGGLDDFCHVGKNAALVVGSCSAVGVGGAILGGTFVAQSAWATFLLANPVGWCILGAHIAIRGNMNILFVPVVVGGALGGAITVAGIAGTVAGVKNISENIPTQAWQSVSSEQLRTMAEAMVEGLQGVEEEWNTQDGELGDAHWLCECPAGHTYVHVDTIVDEEELDEVERLRCALCDQHAVCHRTRDGDGGGGDEEAGATASSSVESFVPMTCSVVCLPCEYYICGKCVQEIASARHRRCMAIELGGSRDDEVVTTSEVSLADPEVKTKPIHDID